MLILLILLLFLIVVDQYTKYWISTHLLLGSSIVIVPHYFDLTYIINPGAAFGILAEYRIVFILVSLILLAAYIYYFKKIVKMCWLNKIAITLLVSGAIGNMIDRIMLNGVIDFFDFKVWPIFNFADIFISFGICLLIFSILVGEGVKE